MIFNITACGVKSNNTSKSPLRQTKDMAENVYDAIKNHDSEKLKEQFCERLQLGKETAVDKIYEYIDGEIEEINCQRDLVSVYMLFLIKAQDMKL